jgi:hypothetical protein
MLGADAEIIVEGAGRLGTERAGASTAALAEHEHHVVVIDVALADVRVIHPNLSPPAEPRPAGEGREVAVHSAERCHGGRSRSHARLIVRL